ncbi:hypothetical protein D3C84_1091540 [compost metagenome]
MAVGVSRRRQLKGDGFVVLFGLAVNVPILQSLFVGVGLRVARFKIHRVQVMGEGFAHGHPGLSQIVKGQTERSD